MTNETPPEPAPKTWEQDPTADCTAPPESWQDTPPELKPGDHTLAAMLRAQLKACQGNHFILHSAAVEQVAAELTRLQARVKELEEASL